VFKFFKKINIKKTLVNFKRRKRKKVKMPSFNVQIKNLTLKNPIITASGTYGYGLEFLDYYDVNLLGGITLKGLSLNPKRGNPVPRIAESASGMLNAIGLENVGLKKFQEEKLPLIQQKLNNTMVISNIFGNTLEEYGEICEKIDNLEGIHAIEINISCPNVKAGGIVFGQDPALAQSVIALTRKKIKNKVMIVKLSPNVTDIAQFALVAQEEGADAVSLINTLKGMAIDKKTKKPLLYNITGGLSGPAIKPIALRMVYEVAQKVKIPIIGMGGVSSGEDVAEFLIAGASLVAIGTANLIDPQSAVKILKEFSDYCKNNEISAVKNLIKKALE